MSKINIAIIGAGWFGCHIATEILSKFKKFSVTIFEEKSDIFEGASGYNQNRLHLGFHYPRSKITRQQSKKGFEMFLRKYPNFSKKINNNFYAVENSNKTHLNFKEFCKVCKNTKLKFKILNQNKYGFKNIEGLIQCDERLILVDEAKKFFKKKLKNNLLLNFKVDNIKKKKNFEVNQFDKKFDILINCTWQKFNNIKKWNLIYEVCVCLIYQKIKLKKKEEDCLTVMDGPFYTLYQWKKRLYNLYSVKYSRIKKFKFYSSATRAIKNLALADKYKLKTKIENYFLNYYPEFLNHFKFKKFFSTIRTIKINSNDDRNFELNIKNNQIDILSGKIDHICLTSDIIIKWLKKKKF
jgi:hypothetical protein